MIRVVSVVIGDEVDRFLVGVVIGDEMRLISVLISVIFWQSNRGWGRLIFPTMGLTRS